MESAAVENIFVVNRINPFVLLFKGLYTLRDSLWLLIDSSALQFPLVDEETHAPREAPNDNVHVRDFFRRCDEAGLMREETYRFKVAKAPFDDIGRDRVRPHWKRRLGKRRFVILRLECAGESALVSALGHDEVKKSSRWILTCGTSCRLRSTAQWR